MPCSRSRAAARKATCGWPPGGIGAAYLTVTGKTSHAGGGTDAAFAGLKARGAVVEGMGLSGFGAHSNAAEYV